MKGKRIQFQYLNSNKCNQEAIKKIYCCCRCAHHLEVFKHCCYNIRKDDCICNESLGFYVCTVREIHEGKRASISGKHGCCELFTERRNHEEV